MTRPTLGLVMIVKDEAASIERVLETVKPHVSMWTILDTGSTDGTQDIVCRVMADVPGGLFEEPFIDFAASRNRVLELSELSAGRQGCPVFVLMLSGDEFLRDGDKVAAQLEAHREGRPKSTVDDGQFSDGPLDQLGCFAIRVMIDDTTLMSPRIFRLGSPWRYVGEVHEYPANKENPKAQIGVISDAVIEHIVSDPEKRLANIWETHIPLLKAKLEENENDERSLIFLAQSYEALLRSNGFNPGERVTYAMEALSLYLRRLAIPTGTEAERNYCRMHFLDRARTVPGLFTDAELFARAELLFKDDAQRPEVALLRATLAIASKLPATRVYLLCREAVEVARAARSLHNSSPVSTACEYQAHYLAAAAAKQLAKKYSDKDLGDGVTYPKLVREHVAAGLQAGGPWDLFKLLSDAPAEAAAPPQ